MKIKKRWDYDGEGTVTIHDGRALTEAELLAVIATVPDAIWTRIDKFWACSSMGEQ